MRLWHSCILSLGTSPFYASVMGFSNWRKGASDWIRSVVFKFYYLFFEQNFMQNSKTGEELPRVNAGVEAFGHYALAQATNTLAKKQAWKWLASSTVLPQGLGMYCSPAQSPFLPTFLSPFMSPLNVTSSEKPSMTMLSNGISYFVSPYLLFTSWDLSPTVMTLFACVFSPACESSVLTTVSHH